VRWYCLASQTVAYWQVTSASLEVHLTTRKHLNKISKRTPATEHFERVKFPLPCRKLIQFQYYISIFLSIHFWMNIYRKILYVRCISLYKNNWQFSDHTAQYEASRYVIFSVQLQLSLIQSNLPELFPYFLFFLCNLSLLFLNNPLKSSGYYMYHVLPTQFTCVLLGSQRNSDFFLIILY
jgi:hypothetical protein